MKNNDYSTNEASHLVSKKKENYNNEKYYDLILEQYKLYAQLLDEHNNRFMNSLKFFVSMQIVFLSGFALILKKEIVFGYSGLFLILLAALTVCFVWFMISKSHYRLITAKYEVLEEMEAFMPLKPFHYEWNNKLNSEKKYTSMTKVFSSLPIIFGLIYSALFVVMILTI
jgi:hypothetical protein